MSTTILRTPQEFQPSKSDGLFFTVSADTSSEPKFRFVYEVYVNGYEVFTGKATPNPYGIGVIDVSRIIDSYVVNYPISYYNTTPIFTHQTSPFSKPYSNEVVDYFIKVGEEYADSFTGQLTGFTGIGNQVGFPGVTGESQKAFLSTMGVNRNSTLQDFNIGRFVLSAATESWPYFTKNLFLTNSPRILEVQSSDYYTLSFTNYELGGSLLSEPYYAQYTFFDDNGTLLSSSTVSNIVSNGGGPRTVCTDDYYDPFTGGTQYNILNIGAGPKNFASLPAGTSYYWVQLFGGATAPPGPSPTPTLTPSPSQGASPTPQATLTSTPTPTATPTPSPSVPSTCYRFQLESYVGFTIKVDYVDCSGVTTSIFVAPYTLYYICSTNVTDPGYGVTITNLGICNPVLGEVGALEITPMNVYVRDCCLGQTSLQVIVDNTLQVGNVVLIGGQCYEIYALGGSGADGNYTTAENFIICNECVASYPCSSQPIDPAVVKPSVQPTYFTPRQGSPSCGNYNAVSEIFQFNIVNKCNVSDSEQIMFKNRYGAWDYFTFMRYRSEGIGIDRQTYGQYNQTWGSQTPIKTNYSRGTSDFITNMTETHIVNSGFITQPEFVWLEDLFTSSDVYLIQTDGTLFPINIVSTEFVRKNKGNRQIFNIEMSYTYSNNIRLLQG